MSSTKPAREIGKSKLAMYLRTKCDRELYLSLFSNSPAALQAAGLPIPLKSRPGVQLITKAGYEFEYDQFDSLIAKLPNNVIHKSNGRTQLDLAAALASAKAKNFILQPAIEPETFRKTAFDNLGVSTQAQTLIPRLKGMRPDVLYVGDPASCEYEVLPNGKRLRVAKDDPRRPLHVIDLKNITEANASLLSGVQKGPLRRVIGVEKGPLILFG